MNKITQPKLPLFRYVCGVGGLYSVCTKIFIFCDFPSSILNSDYFQGKVIQTNYLIITVQRVAVVFAQDTFRPKEFWPKSGYAILGQFRWLGSPPQALEAWFVVTQGPPQTLDALIDLGKKCSGRIMSGRKLFWAYAQGIVQRWILLNS